MLKKLARSMDWPELVGWFVVIAALLTLLWGLGTFLRPDPIPAAINPAGFTVHEHKVPSGKSCYMLYSGTEVVAFTCD